MCFKRMQLSNRSLSIFSTVVSLLLSIAKKVHAATATATLCMLAQSVLRTVYITQLLVLQS
jgi:hypothetical protein